MIKKKKHYIFIEDKFVSGILNGAIKALIFYTNPFEKKPNKNDIIVFQSKRYNNFEKIYMGSDIIELADIDINIARQCGFKTIELLIDELNNRFNYETNKNHMCYILYLNNLCSDIRKKDMRLNTLSYSNISYYNPEYDEKPWRF